MISDQAPNESAEALPSEEEIRQARAARASANVAAKLAAERARLQAELESRPERIAARVEAEALERERAERRQMARDLINEFFAKAERTMPLTRASCTYSTTDESFPEFLRSVFRPRQTSLRGSPVYDRRIRSSGYQISWNVLLEPPKTAIRQSKNHGGRVWFGRYSPVEEAFTAQGVGASPVIPLHRWSAVADPDELRTLLREGLIYVRD